VVSEAAGYMLRNHLYDFSTGVNKMSGSFTTYINTYRAPFMFSRWTGSYTDLTTILHELGHFTNYYHNPSAGWSAGDSLDLAEIDSQGLELLMTPYFDQYYGTVAQQAVSSLLSDCLYALISGCMEDEFQQLIYQTPTMTLDELNSLYERLEQEYGLASKFGPTGLEWVLIPHTFQTPMYYISYAVSMAAALELYEMALNGNQSQAREIYLAILNRPSFAAFREELQENGLSDVFDESTIQRLGEELSGS
jgi:oligoendopeptidase F